MASRLGPGEVRLEGLDKYGKPWRITMGATGGVGWTTVWTADFDADGQRDLLIGQHFPGNGACTGYATILVVLFDGLGRPVPWEAGTNLPRSENDQFPYVPVLAKDADHNGVAEFSLTECDPGKPPRVVAVHGVSIQRLFPDYEAKATDRLEELRSEEFACGRESCPPDSAILAGGRRIDWPALLIVDGPEGREIFADGPSSWAAMFRLLRDGYPGQNRRMALGGCASTFEARRGRGRSRGAWFAEVAGASSRWRLPGYRTRWKSELA